MMQVGLNFPQIQQNPDIVRHMTEFLSHDSDNRLKAIQSSGQNNHAFRMTSLVIAGGVAVVILAIPLIALYRNDMAFVREFLDRYLTLFITIVLALGAGAKLRDFFK
jgi:hypothetical protein